MTTEKGIVYGGTDIVDPLEGTRSLGAYCQKRLNEIGEVVVLVSHKYHGWLIYEITI